MPQTVFISVSRFIIAASSILAISTCCVLLGLSAWMIAYRYQWETWHGLAQINAPGGATYRNKPVRYIPLNLWMGSYYFSLAVACIGLFLCFIMAFVNIRKDLHSRILHYTFPRLQTTLVPATILLVLSIAVAIYSWELDRRSYVFGPFYDTTEYHKISIGTYTLDNFSCQLSPWLAGTQAERTATACKMGRIMRWMIVPLIAFSYISLTTAVTAITADKKHKFEIEQQQSREKKDSFETRSGLSEPSQWGLHVQQNMQHIPRAELETSCTRGSDTVWTPAPAELHHRAYAPDRDVHETQGKDIFEKQGREIVEKHGLERIELPAAQAKETFTT